MREYKDINFLIQQNAYLFRTRKEVRQLDSDEE
jgi:hypothetical protein